MMKATKRLLLAAMLLLASVPATKAGESLGAYLKAGFNMSNYVMGEMPHGMKPGFHFGAGYEYRMAPRWGMAVEMYMSFQGAKFDPKKIDNIYEVMEADEQGVKLDKDITLNAIYFELPVLAKFYVTPRLSIDLGPQLGIAAQNHLKMGDVQVDKVGRSFEAWDLSASAGLTWCVTSRLLVQARYNLSLIKAMKGVDIDEYMPQAGNRNYDDRIQNIQLSVGYRF